MITVVSIALYATSVFFAANVGVTAERFSRKQADKYEGRLAVFLTVVPFMLAAILQVCA